MSSFNQTVGIPGGATITPPSSVQTSSEYKEDAWGRSKSVIDKSILHGMFTYNIPRDKWKELHNGVEQTGFTSATSVDGKLNLSSTTTQGQIRTLETFRNPRYQPNRGHMYSSSMFLPNPSAIGIRRFGFFNSESGVFFQLEDGVLSGVVRTTVGGVTSEDVRLITTEVDLSLGNIFDIQMQWRGVGNYTFYINLKPVLVIDYLGTISELSMSNPAKPISFECICTDGTEVILNCGCVDISSEGGDESGGSYGSIGSSSDSGQASISGFNIPIIAVKSKATIDGKINTRDTLALLASAYGDQRAMLRVWATRDLTAVAPNDQNWVDFGDGHLDYIAYDQPDVTTPMDFDSSKASLIFTCRVNQDETYATSALFEGRTNIYITPGDMLVFTMHRENGLAMNAGVTFEFSEDI